MAKPVTLGFVYGAATPIVLATATAMVVFAGGNMFAIALTGVIVAMVSAPIAIGVTLVFGVPFYFAYQRLRITSLAAYLAMGLALSVSVVAISLWDEYIFGYMNAREALLQHTIEIVRLISGPAATAVFWSTVRPDKPDAHDNGSFARRIVGFIALGMVSLAWVASSIYSMTIASRVPKSPLKSEYFSFDSTKSAALIESLKAYASSHAAHMGYFFMPVRVPRNRKNAPAMPLVIVSANLRFRDDINITVTNSGNKGLFVGVYSQTNSENEHADQIWSDFLSFLRPAVEHADSLPPPDLPKVPWRGEGGVLETHWWDWRFHRQ
jgi:hypothetical protein